MTCLENRGTLLQPESLIEAERKKLNVFIRDYGMKHGGPGGARLVDLGERLVDLGENVTDSYLITASHSRIEGSTYDFHPDILISSIPFQMYICLMQA